MSEGKEEITISRNRLKTFEFSELISLLIVFQYSNTKTNFIWQELSNRKLTLSELAEIYLQIPSLKNKAFQKINAQNFSTTELREILFGFTSDDILLKEIAELILKGEYDKKDLMAIIAKVSSLKDKAFKILLDRSITKEELIQIIKTEDDLKIQAWEMLWNTFTVDKADIFSILTLQEDFACVMDINDDYVDKRLIKIRQLKENVCLKIINERPQKNLLGLILKHADTCDPIIQEKAGMQILSNNPTDQELQTIISNVKNLRNMAQQFYDHPVRRLKRIVCKIIDLFI